MAATTMQDIARLAGVSRVAVSYALNGRPGVSAELRERILTIARQVGFSPNAQALAMRGASANAVGLVLQRPSSGFHQELISGMQIALSARGFGLVLQFAASTREELAIYRRWHAERRIDGIVVCDPRVDDARIPALKRLGLPTVVIGGRGDHAGLASLWSDEGAAAVKAAGYLHALGHRRVALEAGVPGTVQTAWRTEAFAAACRDFGLTLTPPPFTIPPPAGPAPPPAGIAPTPASGAARNAGPEAPPASGSLHNAAAVPGAAAAFGTPRDAASAGADPVSTPPSPGSPGNLTAASAPPPSADARRVHSRASTPPASDAPASDALGVATPGAPRNLASAPPPSAADARRVHGRLPRRRPLTRPPLTRRPLTRSALPRLARLASSPPRRTPLPRAIRSTGWERRVRAGPPAWTTGGGRPRSCTTTT